MTSHDHAKAIPLSRADAGGDRACDLIRPARQNDKLRRSVSNQPPQDVRLLTVPASTAIALGCAAAARDLSAFPRP
jgi:hypothetical protein